jgi:hypothetical protein
MRSRLRQWQIEDGEGAARCPSCSQSPHDERGGMTPVLIPCSRSAHDQNVLARRPQWDQHGCHSKREKRASLEGRERSRQTILLARRTRTMRQCSSDARSEGQSGDSFGGGDAEQRRPSPGLMARLGVPVGGWVRKLRAVGDHLARPQGRR